MHNTLAFDKKIKTKKHKFCVSFVLNIKRYNKGAYSVLNGCGDVLQKQQFQSNTNRFIIINHCEKKTNIFFAFAITRCNLKKINRRHVPEVGLFTGGAGI